MPRFLALLLALGTAALAGPAEAPSPEAPEALAPRQEGRLQAMHRHLGQVEALHLAVVEARLDDARQKARALSEPTEIADMPDAWRPYLQNMRDSASRASGRWSRDDAARTVAEVGRQCGACHAFVGGGPKVEVPGTTLSGTRAHAEASRGLWTALVAGEPDAFKRSALALQNAELTGVRRADANRFRELATRGTHATSRAIMADTYGELLATCAPCHARMKP